MNHNEREKLYLPVYALAALVLLMFIWYYCYGFIGQWHLHNYITDYMLFDVGVPMHLYSTQFTGKAFIILLIILCQIVRAGKTIKDSWASLLTWLAIALAVFFFPRLAPDKMWGQTLFFLTSVTGFILCGSAIGRIGRKVHGTDESEMNDPLETFAQCNQKIENEYSVNIPTRYKYRGRHHNGWINVINPFRASMVMGTPGSGKSFSVYNPFIEQMVRKGYTMLVYDYKYPDLTKVVYNVYLGNRDVYLKKYGVVPQFCVINFNDPRYSMRCNPVHPKYINDPADTTEIAETVFKNINKSGVKDGEFFTESAKVYLDALLYFLRRHQNGKYCDFPHLIELMTRNYKAVFKMMQKYPELEVKMTPFRNALKGNAQEQLQGQIASAQIPLMRFASAALYWVLSGDDFTLDINNPKQPKIVCIGNDPKRQSIYGTTLALYTSRIFAEINAKGKLPCGVLLDEVPTIFIKGLDNLIATARSNKVAIVLGAQDKSQLIRDYGDKEAEVIFNTVGNVFAGQVNGRTAKELADTFGREFRQQESETTGGENDTVNRSMHQQDILPQSRIETLSQGYFFGKVADNNNQQIRRKCFCGMIQIDVDRWNAMEEAWVDIPKVSRADFHEEQIEARVRESAEDFILEALFERVKRERGEEGAWQEAEDRYGRMSEEEREAVLSEVIEAKQKEEVDNIVQENYRRIRADIKDIFRYEDVKEFDDDDEEAQEEAPAVGEDIEDATQARPFGGRGGHFESADPNEDDDEEDDD